MTRPDLHIHSIYSDGVLTPSSLLEEARRAGLTALSITDHDTFQGSDLLLRAAADIQVIAGVELSLCDMQGLHLLGYGLSEGSELRQAVEAQTNRRVQRAREMVRRLEEMGMPLNWEQLQKRCSGSIGRPHIARAMVHSGYAVSMQEAFEKYLGHGKPAYVPGERLSIAKAIPLMRRSGFVPVLAHPCELHLPAHQLCALVEKWQGLGLMGMEVYHPSALSCGFTELEHMARRFGLLVTGGSDFHQPNDKHGSLGCMCGAWKTADQDLLSLMEAMRSQASTTV